MYIAIKKTMTGESVGQVKRKLIQQNLNPDDYEIIELGDREDVDGDDCIMEAKYEQHYTMIHRTRDLLDKLADKYGENDA